MIRNTPSSVAYKKQNNSKFFSYINPVYSPNQASTANTNHIHDEGEKKIDQAKRERRKLSQVNSGFSNNQGFNPDKVFDPKQIFKKIRDTHANTSINISKNIDKTDKGITTKSLITFDKKVDKNIKDSLHRQYGIDDYNLQNYWENKLEEIT